MPLFYVDGVYYCDVCSEPARHCGCNDEDSESTESDENPELTDHERNK